MIVKMSDESDTGSASEQISAHCQLIMRNQLKRQHGYPTALQRFKEQLNRDKMTGVNPLTIFPEEVSTFKCKI